MPPSPRTPATSHRRRPSPSVSVVISIDDPRGLPLMLRGLPEVDEVIVVNDGPPGETTAAVRAACPDALVVRPGRSGAGNALASGLAASSGDVVVTLNGDGSTDPGEIPRYVAALTGGADVALGSRYRDGGRDLTGGRFRRWANLVLIWLVNMLFGSRRTDPGFGYAAFWRDALDRLDLPDPSARHAAAWGDGPEIGPLLAVRPEARGLRVAEVGSVAYPRLRRTARAERPRVRDWIRVMAREYAQQAGRHTPDAAAGEALVAPLRPGRNALTPLRPGRNALTPLRPGRDAPTPLRPGRSGGRALADPAATSTNDWAPSSTAGPAAASSYGPTGASTYDPAAGSTYDPAAGSTYDPAAGSTSTRQPPRPPARQPPRPTTRGPPRPAARGPSRPAVRRPARPPTRARRAGRRPTGGRRASRSGGRRGAGPRRRTTCGGTARTTPRTSPRDPTRTRSHGPGTPGTRGGPAGRT